MSRLKRVTRLKETLIIVESEFHTSRAVFARLSDDVSNRQLTTG